MTGKPAIDAAVFSLNTSALNFDVWLLSHYLKSEFPLENGPWRLQPPHPVGMPGGHRLDVIAVPNPNTGQEARPDQILQAAELALRFDVVEIGTLLQARLEVVAVCFSYSLPLRVHFHGVLGAIAATWPEASADINKVRRKFAQEVGEEAARIPPPPPRPRALGGPPWLQVADHSWDRRAVELLHQDLSYGEIARRIGNDVTAKTVRNRLSVLRGAYGPTIVPPRQAPRNSRQARGTFRKRRDTCRKFRDT